MGLVRKQVMAQQGAGSAIGGGGDSEEDGARRALPAQSVTRHAAVHARDVQQVWLAPTKVVVGPLGGNVAGAGACGKGGA